MSPVTHDALFLAALASGAVPGLRPIRAELALDRPGERFMVAFVEDVEHRRWVVRLPVDAVSGGQQEASVALLELLARRVPFAVPTPKGFAAVKDGRRAMVYPYLAGHPLTFEAIPPGVGLAGELGRALASLHNVDRRLFEEAAVPGYLAGECRHRHLVTVDRAAVLGEVPVRLLARWERSLDDVSLWRFAPVPIHGRIDGGHVLAGFGDAQDSSSGRVRGIVGWENAQVGDPAEDLAALVGQAAPETVDTVLEAYAMSRLQHPDPHLEGRARLLAELRLVDDLLWASTVKDRAAIAAATEALRRLDAAVGDPSVPSPPRRPDPAADITPASAPVDDRLYRAGTPAVAPTEAVDSTDHVELEDGDHIGRGDRHDRHDRDDHGDRGTHAAFPVPRDVAHDAPREADRVTRAAPGGRPASPAVRFDDEADPQPTD